MAAFPIPPPRQQAPQQTAPPASSPVGQVTPKNPMQARMLELLDSNDAGTVFGYMSNDPQVMAKYNGDIELLKKDLAEVSSPGILARQARLMQEEQAQKATPLGRILNFATGALSAAPPLSQVGNWRRWGPGAAVGAVNAAFGSGRPDINTPENRGALAQAAMTGIEQNVSAAGRLAKKHPFANIAGQSFISTMFGHGSDVSTPEQIIGGAVIPGLMGAAGARAQGIANRTQAAEDAITAARRTQAQEQRILARAQKHARQYQKILGDSYDPADAFNRSLKQDEYLGKTIKGLSGETAWETPWVKGLSDRMGGDAKALAFAKEIEEAGGSGEYLTKLVSDIFEPAAAKEGGAKILLGATERNKLFSKLDKYRKFYENSGVDMQKVLQDETVAHFVERFSDPKRNLEAAQRVLNIMERPGLYKNSEAFFTQIFGSANDPRVRRLYGLAKVTDQLSDTFEKMQKAGVAVPKVAEESIWKKVANLALLRFDKFGMLGSLIREINVKDPNAFKNLNRILDIYSLSIDRNLEKHNQRKRLTRTAESPEVLQKLGVPVQVPPGAPQIPLR